MADWGLLQGLGQGLQMAGNAWTEKSKDELRNKLLEEREARAEERAIAREDRAAKRQADTVAGYRPEIDSSGVLWIQGHNAAGDARGEKRLATPSELEDYKLKRDKERLTLEDLTTKAAINKFKADRLDTEAAQDDALFNARKSLLNAQAYAATARADNAGVRSSGRSGRTSLEEETTPVALSDLASSLLEDQKALLKEYDLTESQKIELARAVIESARKQGKDPVDTLRRALPDFSARLKAGSKAKPKSGLLK